jgi:hypothetical protein
MPYAESATLETGTAATAVDSRAAFPASAEAPFTTTLREETALMDRAFRALRDGDRAGAADLVSEHERRFPNGLLKRERERARAALTRVLDAEQR